MHKGLVFRRRTEHVKKAKDLYYIFDILANTEGFERQIDEGLAELKKKYRPWFKTFVNSIAEYFVEPTSEGVDLIFSQRPPNSFINLTDDQFKLYVFRMFQDLISKIKSC